MQRVKRKSKDFFFRAPQFETYRQICSWPWICHSACFMSPGHFRFVLGGFLFHNKFWTIWSRFFTQASALLVKRSMRSAALFLSLIRTTQWIDEPLYGTKREIIRIGKALAAPIVLTRCGHLAPSSLSGIISYGEKHLSDYFGTQLAYFEVIPWHAKVNRIVVKSD